MSAFAGKYPQLFGPLAAALVLFGFWLAMLASLRSKSQTYDEGAHAAAGYSYWRFNDYRLDPENGNLPQRVFGLPLFLGNYRFPDTNSAAWRGGDEWAVPYQWFYTLGNDAQRMTQLGRAASGLIAVALGFLVWRWSRHLFGPLGGMLSLILYVFDPSILANGALMTSDTASALFFLAATWAWWRMIQRIAWRRVLISGLTLAALLLSKMSGPLIVPVALLLLVATIIDRRPIRLALAGQRDLDTRRAKVTTLCGVTLAAAAFAVAVIWAFYGFRYSAFAASMPSEWTDPTWETVLLKPPPREIFDSLQLDGAERNRVGEVFTREDGDLNSWSLGSRLALDVVKREALTREQVTRLDSVMSQHSQHAVPRVLELLRQYRVLPEAYIYGAAFTWVDSRGHSAFLNGHFSMTGWRLFFPYTFAVKTPIATFVVMLLAIGATIGRLRRATRNGATMWNCVRDFLPLWVLLAVYWSAAIGNHINIGHRHILPVYPPIFVLCGVAADWIHRLMKRGSVVPTKFKQAIPAALAVILSIICLAGEICYRFPNYIAYFNGIVKPVTAYRHLVDSSLDWGQDLPGLARYISSKYPDYPCYLAYFGTASPDYFGIRARSMYTVDAVHILTFPAEQAEELLQQFLHEQSDYDPDVVLSTHEGELVVATVVKRPDLLRLRPGIYFVSATLLQPVTPAARSLFGPWNLRVEQEYQKGRALVAPLLSDDILTRRTALAKYRPDTWRGVVRDYGRVRFYRLAAFLRHREPDDTVNYSILVYRLSEDDLSRALDGPPAELGPDLLRQTNQQ
jgi:4-amino-4-deoxy-L-arabinose transferase-like glycosyltransferase